MYQTCLLFTLLNLLFENFTLAQNWQSQKTQISFSTIQKRKNFSFVYAFSTGTILTQVLLSLLFENSTVPLTAACTVKSLPR